MTFTPNGQGSDQAAPYAGPQSVLIIDDDEETRMLLKTVLSAARVAVFSVASGHEGLHFMKSIRPDVIILDVCMPGMDGFETCTRIRKIDNVPVIMLSVMDRGIDIMRALNAGANEYLTKPCPPSQLTATVRRMLDQPSWSLD